MQFRWTGDTRRVRHGTGQVIKPGQFFEPTVHELRAFGDRIERIEEDDDGGDDDDEVNEETDT